MRTKEQMRAYSREYYRQNKERLNAQRKSSRLQEKNLVKDDIYYNSKMLIEDSPERAARMINKVLKRKVIFVA
jgi:hypothetical protein